MAKMRVHRADQNTNDVRDLAKKRQGKKLFLSHKTLDCLNLLKCTYTVTVIQASWHFLYLLHLHFLLNVNLSSVRDDVSLMVVFQ